MRLPKEMRVRKRQGPPGPPLVAAPDQGPPTIAAPAPAPAAPTPEIETLTPLVGGAQETPAPVIAVPEAAPAPVEEAEEPAPEAAEPEAPEENPDPTAGLSFVTLNPGAAPGVLTTLTAGAPVAAITEPPQLAVEVPEEGGEEVGEIEELEEIEEAEEREEAAETEGLELDFIGTIAEDVPDVTPVSDPFPEVDDDDSTASAGVTGLGDGQKGGIAVGSIAGFAFIVTIILFYVKWRKGQLPRLALTSRPSSPDMSQSLVQSSSATANDWNYQDTFADPARVQSITRSITRVLRNPLTAAQAPEGPRKSWGIWSRASRPAPPAHKGGVDSAWSVRSSVASEVEKGEVKTVRESLRASGTFGAPSRKSAFSVMTASTSDSSSGTTVSSVTELPPIPRMVSLWSDSSSDEKSGSEGRASVSPSSQRDSIGSSGTLGGGAKNNAKRDTALTFGVVPQVISSPIPAPTPAVYSEPPVHPLRAHQVHPVITPEADRGNSWPLPQ